MALADRDYMRDEERNWRWSASIVLMAIITVAFIAQKLAESQFQHDEDAARFYDLFALQADSFLHGYVWQLLTFQFLHAGIWHLLGNLLGIWFFGRFIENRLGNANMLKIYFAGGFAGGLLQVLIGWVFPAQVIGASAGVVALFAAFAMLEPDAQILLWFVLPVRARHLLWISLGVSILFLLMFENSGIAHAAHLGGLLTGMAFIHWQLYSIQSRPVWRPLGSRQRKRELVWAAFHTGLWQTGPAEPETELPAEEFISKEVDPILDKISAHGIQSLTDRERKILEAARRKMDKR